MMVSLWEIKELRFKKNDLPKVLQNFANYSHDNDFEVLGVTKDEVLKETENSLSIGRYTRDTQYTSTHPMVKLGSIIELKYGKPLKEENRTGEGFPVYGSHGIVGFHEEYLVEGPCIIVGRKGSAGAVTFSKENAFSIDTTFYVKLKNEEVNLVYIFFSLKKLPLRTLNVQSDVPGLNRNYAYELEIPLPPIEIQKEIVEELEGYQKIIDGCRQVVENYKSIIDIEPSWKMVKLREICKISSGGTPKAGKKKYYKNGHIPWVRSGEVDGRFITEAKIRITQLGLDESSAKLFPLNSVLVAMYGVIAGKVGMLGIEAAINQAVCAIFPI